MGQKFSSSTSSSDRKHEELQELWPSLKKGCDGGADDGSTCTEETETTYSSELESVDSDGSENTVFPYLEDSVPALLSPEQLTTYSFAKAHNEMAMTALGHPSPDVKTYQQALFHLIQASSTFSFASSFAMSETLSFELDRTYRYAVVLSNSTSFQDCPILDQAGLNESMGILYAHFGNHQAALVHFRCAEHILFARVTVPARRILPCAANVAAACFALEDFHGTIQACRKALSLFDFGACAATTSIAQAHQLLLVSLHKMMGESFLRLKKWDKAMQSFHQALHALPPAGPFGSLLAEIYHGMSFISVHQKKQHGCSY